jgi:hypothetical protein
MPVRMQTTAPPEPSFVTPQADPKPVPGSIPDGWSKDGDTWIVPNSFFDMCSGLGLGSKVLDDGSKVHIWMRKGTWVPVPENWSFFGVSSLLEAGDIMLAAKKVWEKKDDIEPVPFPDPFPDPEPMPEPEPGPTKPVLTMHGLKKAIFHAADIKVGPNGKFDFEGHTWWAEHKGGKFIGVWPNVLKEWQMLPLPLVEKKVYAAFSTWGSILNPVSLPDPAEPVLNTELLHTVYQHVLDTGIDKGAVFDFDGHQWFYEGHDGPMPNHMDDYNSVQPWSWYHEKWTEFQATYVPTQSTQGLTDEWLWPAFDLWKANGCTTDDFSYDGVDWCVLKYSIGSGYLSTTPTAAPVPIDPTELQGAPSDLFEANTIIWQSYLKWTLPSEDTANDTIQQVSGGKFASEWIAATADGTLATYTTAAPPFPGTKFPKWGPATLKFEQALDAALKKRLGPYATDSMRNAVVEDMLPVLDDYWTEVNSALVALKMTAAEQGKDVPKSMPGWKPGEKKVPDTAVPSDLPTIGHTKMETATAIWKSNLSPYLKKTYAAKIDTGVAMGLLPQGTGLDTPFIDLWIMSLKKHTKKGTPPTADQVKAATDEWKALIK